MMGNCLKINNLKYWGWGRRALTCLSFVFVCFSIPRLFFFVSFCVIIHTIHTHFMFINLRSRSSDSLIVWKFIESQDDAGDAVWFPLLAIQATMKRAIPSGTFAICQISERFREWDFYHLLLNLFQLGIWTRSSSKSVKTEISSSLSSIRPIIVANTRV